MLKQVPGQRPVLGLDADDTLWENEARFYEAQSGFCELMLPWADRETADAALLTSDRAAVARYGYGVKGFVLSMIRAAIQLSSGTVTATKIAQIMALGDRILDAPVELLPGVRETLEELSTKYRLLVITKGDVRDQMAKITRSDLVEFFWQVEVVSEKDEATYRAVLGRYDIDPVAFTMVGNSVVSDVLPVLAVGGEAIHVPHHTTWELEVADPSAVAGLEFPVIKSITEVPELLADRHVKARKAP
ncbi:MAG: HAD family hydrolase [Actinomycetota bacterium]|nr:HAD family hydrolase [Actinomycetota bacterium]